MNSNETEKLRAQLRDAAIMAISKMGMTRFRQTSFFASNARRVIADAA